MVLIPLVDAHVIFSSELVANSLDNRALLFEFAIQKLLVLIGCGVQVVLIIDEQLILESHGAPLRRNCGHYITLV